MERRIRFTLVCLLTGALIALQLACPGTDGDDDDDSAGPAMVALTGVVVDPVLAAQGEPVEGAWVVVDTGADELFTTTSGADGRFTFEVPEEGVFTVTVGKDDHYTRTVTETLANIPDPAADLLYMLSRVHATDYPAVEVYVHGTISGAPPLARVYFYGNDQNGASGFSTGNGDPIEYDFTTVVRGGPESLWFSVIVLDAYPTQVALAGTVVEVPVHDDVELDITIPETPATTLTLTTNRPTLNGEEFGTLGEAYAYGGGMTYIVHRSFSVTGFAETWQDVGTGYEFAIPCFPQEGHNNGVRAYLNDGTAGSPAALAYIPVDTATATLDVELLDSAVVDEYARFSADAPLTFEPATGAAFHQLWVANGSGESVWFYDTTQTEFTFPRMPDEPPGDLLPDSTGLMWYLMSIDNGGVPRDELFSYETEFRQSYVPGGAVEL